VRRIGFRNPFGRVLFQSTHPMRGATRCGRQRAASNTHFNPRTPCGVRLLQHLLRSLKVWDFNPRTPCGVRRKMKRGFGGKLDFNPRTPCGVRPLNNFSVINCIVISIHAPHAGCDAKGIPHVIALTDFNPRTPCGVRPEQVVLAEESWRISIHAPHAGCDQFQHIFNAMYFNFNPRTPCGVRPDTKVWLSRMTVISIHAPHAGCDLDDRSKCWRKLLFQSTHPMRGATSINLQCYVL